MIRSNVVYEFGPYRLDPARRLLVRAGVGVVVLAPKAFDLLLLLVESQGQVLTKNELMSALWSDTFVEAGNLAFQVGLLRRALGGEGAHWIETVPKRGYRFNESASGLSLHHVNAEIEVSRVLDHVLTEVHPDVSQVESSASQGWRAAPWQVLVLLGILVAAVLVVFARGDAPHHGRTVRFFVSPPDKIIFRDSSIPAISPDGKWLAFVGVTPEGGRKLWIRDMASLTAEPVTGTELADSPFWSPDSRSIAFFSDGKLKRIDLRDRTLRTVCDAPGGNGRERAAGSWGRSGLILLQTDTHRQLYVVAESGGTPKPATFLDPSKLEDLHYAPYFLPDGRHFLYSVQSDEFENAGVVVGSLNSRERKHLISSATNASYAESSDGKGYLLFTRGADLMGMRFDPKELKLSGEAFPVAKHLLIDAYPGLARASFSASENGVLVYRTGVDAGSTELVWFDRQGNRIGRLGEPADYANPALSPDESKLAVSRMDPEKRTRDLWIFDLVHANSSRFTFDPGDENKPIWSPDGSKIAYNVNYRGDSSDIFEKEITGTSEPKLLLTSNENKSLEGWSPDGRFITYRMGKAVWALPLEGDQSPKRTVVDGIPHIGAAELSPDGRWIAYQTNEANRAEIYVQRTRPPGRKWQLTTAGGAEPHWRRDGKELFFVKQDTLMAVPVKTNAGFETGTPKPLFELRLQTAAHRSRYQVAANGERFLVSRLVESSSAIIVTIDWTDGVRP